MKRSCRDIYVDKSAHRRWYTGHKEAVLGMFDQYGGERDLSPVYEYGSMSMSKATVSV